ncbi:hypothetical protein RIF29_31327 [Crotalaria pallida]|uniref:PPM-type phosphatase domain-containing protein n=1 Tax=Crotalaria pallida TaxID=3830 RepID=A0AAN9EHK9_CROPI
MVVSTHNPPTNCMRKVLRKWYHSTYVEKTIGMTKDMSDRLSSFMLVLSVISREVLVDEGHRQVVELEQAAIWRFLWWSAAILIKVLLFVANLGDAKAVLARSTITDGSQDHSNGVSVLKAIVLIREHKPIFPRERARIQKTLPRIDPKVGSGVTGAFFVEDSMHSAKEAVFDVDSD